VKDVEDQKLNISSIPAPSSINDLVVFIENNRHSFSENPELWKQAGHICGDLKDRERQIEYYKEYISLTNNVSGYWFVATIYHRLKNYELAMSNFEKIRVLGKHKNYEPLFSIHLAHCQMKFGELESAQRTLHAVIIDFPNEDFKNFILYCGERITTSELARKLSVDLDN